MTATESIEAVATELNLSMDAQFVPWSQSRNAGERHPSLNWNVKLHRNGRVFLTTDYMAGMGHCPSNSQRFGYGAMTMDEYDAIKRECETGKGGRPTFSKSILPKFADVLHSLVSDADALDYGDFESWADEMGYERDSRKAETTYRACLEIGLKLRNALGESGLGRLREACQDY